MKIKIVATVLPLILYLSVYGEDIGVARSFPIVLRVFPHDAHAFTQGLLYYNGFLYESTGLYGQSSLRRVDPEDGRVIKSVPVSDIFAEGLARMGDELVQLSWKEKAALVYSLKDFSLTSSFSYTGEGWGLTSDSSQFIMSNGSDTLYLRSKIFAVRKKVPVTLNGRPLKLLNELEYVKGIVYANIWYGTAIVAIELKTGKVVRVIDCAELVRKAHIQNEDEVLNGIAYNPATGTFFVTGKNWPVMFEVKW